MLKINSNQKTTWHVKQIEPYYFIQGTFYDPDIEEAKVVIKEFNTQIKQVQAFIKSQIDLINDQEKKHDLNVQRVQGLN